MMNIYSIFSKVRIHDYSSLFSLILISFCIANLNAQITWQGATSDDWHDQANWSSATIPTASDDVIIATTIGGADPTIKNADAVAKSIIINQGTALTVDFNINLTVDGSDLNGISLSGALINNGFTKVKNSTENGIILEVGSQLQGLGGEIKVDSSGHNGIWNKGGAFTNVQTTFIFDSGTNYYSLLNESIVNNNPCGILSINNGLNNVSGAQINNDGLLSLNGEQLSLSDGMIINNGVIKDLFNNLPNANIINTELILAQRTLTTSASVVTNAFGVGSSSSFIITGIYTDFTFSTSAGSYDPMANEFVASSDFDHGINDLAVQIEDPNGGCTRSITWRINNTLCDGNTDADKNWTGPDIFWSNPDNWCPPGIPTTGDYVDLGMNNTVRYNLDFDPLSKLDIGSNTELTILPGMTIEIDGDLSAQSQTHLLYNHGGTVINRGDLQIKNADGIGIYSLSNPSATIDNYGDIEVANTARTINGAFGVEVNGSNSIWTNHPESRLRIHNASSGGMVINNQGQVVNKPLACLDIYASDAYGLLMKNNSTMVNESESILKVINMESNAIPIDVQPGSTIDWESNVDIGNKGVNNLKLRTEFGDPAVMAVDTQGIFAIWWYPDVMDHSDDTPIMFDYLELVRSECLNNLGMQDPPNPADGYFFNIYIHHNSNDPFPNDWSNGIGTDMYGMPYFTVPIGLETDYNNTMHEGFHMFQYSSDNESYGYGGDSQWFVETTAQWFKTAMNRPTDQYTGDDQLYKESTAKGQNPQLALWHSDFNGAPGDYIGWLYGIQQYGLQSLLNFLEVEKGIDPAIFVSGYYNNTTLLPQEYLYQNIGGSAFRDHISDWAAHNVGGFDYLTPAQVQVADTELAHWAGMNPAALHPYILKLTDQGITNFVPSDETYKPRGWGYSVVKINNSQAATYEFDFDGDTTGSEGAAAHFELRVVIMEPSGPRYETVNMSNDLHGVKTINVNASDTEVYLIIMSVPEHFTGYQTYGFTLDINKV